MGNIYCLMGKSASGKDTIYNRLLAMEKLHLRRVVPYTTRPMRSGETDGQTFLEGKAAMFHGYPALMQEFQEQMDAELTRIPFFSG